MVYRPDAASHAPTAARGSIVTPVTRWIHVRRRTTWFARASADWTAASSPPVESTQTFDAVVSYRIGASAAAAATADVTADNGVQSTRTRSAPSRAAAAVSATTIATTSPTKRARSAGIGGCGAVNETF